MKILLIDNYDSFTYNLADYISRCGVEVVILRNNVFNIEEIKLSDFDGVVLSPGPSIPENAGLLMPFIQRFATDIPILGVCLGFQALGIHFGARLVRGEVPVHGKSSEIVCLAHMMYQDIPSRHQVARYHSLCLTDLPNCLLITAQTREGIPMAFAHQSLPIWGVQYHPEAVLSEFGLHFIRNWVEMLKLSRR